MEAVRLAWVWVTAGRPSQRGRHGRRQGGCCGESRSNGGQPTRRTASTSWWLVAGVVRLPWWEVGGGGNVTKRPVKGRMVEAAMAVAP